jgi:hypothetical protein
MNLLFRDRWPPSNEWPFEPLGYVFFAKGLNLIGAQLSNDWDGTEFTVDAPPPPFAIANNSQTRNLAFLLNGMPPPWPDREPTPDEWEIAFNKQHSRREELLPKQLRRRSVETFIKKLATGGLLKIRYREDDTGKMIPTDPTWWNADNLSARFSLCRLSPRFPFPKAPAGAIEFSSWATTQRNWLFFEEADLDRIVTLKESSKRGAISSKPPEFSPTPASEANLSEPPALPQPAGLPVDRDAECRRVAGLLDEQGVPKREVTASDVQRLWDEGRGGPRVSVPSITSLMKGGKRGNPGARDRKT